MNTQKVKVTGLTITGPVYKSRDSSGRPCFAVDGIYTLENGETHKTRVTSAKKKEMDLRIARKQEHVSKGEVQIDGNWEVISYSMF